MRWIPNALTLLRVLMIPLFLWLIFGHGDPRPAEWALLVFALASFTDFLDGYLARKWNVISNFGKIADPLADKLLVLSALSALTWLEPFRLWLPFIILIFLRELVITILREIYLKRGIVLPADRLGKIKTVAQMIGIIACLACWAWLSPVPAGVVAAAQAWFAAVTVLTLYSGYNYLKPKLKA